MEDSIIGRQQEIERRMQRGQSLAQIEDEVIDPSSFDEEQKSALWLFAWSSMTPSQQRIQASLLVQGSALIAV